MHLFNFVFSLWFFYFFVKKNFSYVFLKLEFFHVSFSFLSKRIHNEDEVKKGIYSIYLPRLISRPNLIIDNTTKYARNKNNKKVSSDNDFISREKN